MKRYLIAGLLCLILAFSVFATGIEIGGGVSKFTADDTYVPYTGADKAVNLGSQTLTTTGTASFGATTVIGNTLTTGNITTTGSIGAGNIGTTNLVVGSIITGESDLRLQGNQEYIGGATITTDTGSLTFTPGGQATVTINNALVVGNSFEATPSAITSVSSAGGITVTAHNMRVTGEAAGIDITANPQIADGANGEIVRLWFESDTNTIKLDDGTGLQLAGGQSFTGGLGDYIELTYFSDVDVWRECSRSDN
uniref:Uncharacterized protein n=1 Tax=viral metagenome TaxID=1070528 RepID=A0A6H1ZCV5_9ZZZZ